MLIREAIVRLEGKLEAVTQQISAHNIASVERDTRIEQQVLKINGKVAEHETKLSTLWTDRTLWNWVTRAVLFAIPPLILIVNYLSNR